MCASTRATAGTSQGILWELATPLQELRAELYERAEICPERFELVRREKLDVTVVEAHAGVLLVCPAQFFPNGTFDLSADGILAGIIEVFDEDDETVIDLVAWSLDNLGKFATAFGYAGGLGLARVRNPATYAGGRPLCIHQTPLAWLKAGCSGVVILRETSVFLWLAGTLGDLAAEDVAHGERLARLLHPFVEPTRILVPRRKAA